MRKHVTLGIGLMVVAVVVGCDKNKGSTGATTGPKGGPDPNKAADVSLTADEFAKEYKADSKGTAAKYKRKVIELSGTVDSFGKNFGGEVQLILGVKGEIVGVICFTADKKPWNQAAPGQTVKIKGTFPEVAISPALVNCVVVEASGPKETVLTAEDLGKAYDADPAAVKAKYKNKSLVLSGTVADKKDEGLRVYFKTSSKVKVLASFTPSDKKDAEAIKPGQPARVVGQFSELYGGDGEVAIGQCLNAGVD